MPLIQVWTNGENMIIIMGNVNIKVLSVCLGTEQLTCRIHSQTLLGGTALPLSAPRP